MQIMYFSCGHKFKSCRHRQEIMSQLSNQVEIGPGHSLRILNLTAIAPRTPTFDNNLNWTFLIQWHQLLNTWDAQMKNDFRIIFGTDFFPSSGHLLKLQRIQRLMQCRCRFQNGDQQQHWCCTSPAWTALVGHFWLARRQQGEGSRPLGNAWKRYLQHQLQHVLLGSQNVDRLWTR